jgi:hypothetical protein
LLTRLRISLWRRLAIALFAVPAILVGLLAMHVLVTAGMSESSAAHAISGHTSDTALVHGADEGAASATAPAPAPSMPVPAEDCGGLCGPSHDMLNMICVLALLVTMVLLTLHLILIRWEKLRRIVAALVAKAAALAPPAPPSLHVLSISRT